MALRRMMRRRILTVHQQGALTREAMITKLYWATWYCDLGELAIDILGDDALTLDPDGVLSEWQRLFLWTRSDTIYAGTNQIQRNIIGERALGLPR